MTVQRDGTGLIAPAGGSTSPAAPTAGSVTMIAATDEDLFSTGEVWDVD